MSYNAISFCLFGNIPMFTVGAVRNAELAKSIYPGWKIIFWLGDSVPDNIVKSLVGDGCDCRPSPTPNPMIGRFMVHDLPGVDRYIVRDTDSRLNEREALAVNEWIESGSKYHVIRDHPGHQVAMPGGLWGGTAGSFSMASLIREWKGNKNAGVREQIYNNDQIFLRECVWPIIQDDVKQHDFCCRDIFRDGDTFPSKFDNWRFCGERFGADDKPETYGWQQRINWMDP